MPKQAAKAEALCTDILGEAINLHQCSVADCNGVYSKIEVKMIDTTLEKITNIHCYGTEQGFGPSSVGCYVTKLRSL